MSKTISIINNKGGVGKTTATVNIGAGLSKLGKRMLLIDLDPQANLTANVGLGESGDGDICDALQGNCPLPIVKITDRLSVVRSSINLSVAERVLADEPGRELLLKKLIAPVAKDYDFILIDCPPSFGFLPLNALTASQVCIIPVELAGFSLAGMKRIIQMVDKVRDRINPELDNYKILFARKNRRQTVQRELAESLASQIGEHLFSSEIRNNVKIVESQMVKKDIFSYDLKSNGAADYMKICEELLEMYP